MVVGIDSNILVYAVDRRDPARQGSALAIIDAAAMIGGQLTLQALAEFADVAVRKRFSTAADAAAQVRRWTAAFPNPRGVTIDALHSALKAREAGLFSLWDALLLATAAVAGCRFLISEEMGHGAALAGVSVVSAFDAQGGISAPARAVLGVT